MLVTPNTDCACAPPPQDRLPQNVIDDINAALGAAREAKDLDDATAIREKASALQQAVMKIGESLAAKGGSGGAAGGDEQKTYDADVKEDEKK